MKFLRFFYASTCFILLVVTLSACSIDNLIRPSKGSQQVSSTSSEEIKSSSSLPEAESSVDSTISTDKSEPSAEETILSSATVTANFEMNSRANPEDVIKFSLDLPQDWTFNPDPDISTIYNSDKWVAQIETQPKIANIDKPFSDIDGMWLNATSTKELTISGKPAKMYSIQSSTENSEQKGTQYLYYIIVDDIYVFIFFDSTNSGLNTEEDFNKIMSTFKLS